MRSVLDFEDDNKMMDNIPQLKVYGRMKELDEMSSRMGVEKRVGDPYLTSRVGGMVRECGDYYNMMMMDTIKKRREVKTDDYLTIFDEDRSAQMEEERKRKLGRLRADLEEAKEAEGNVYDREGEKIALKFPKDFFFRQEDLMKQMQDEYRDVMDVQNKYIMERVNRMMVDVDSVTTDMNGVRCHNVEMIERMSKGLMVGYMMNRNDLVEMIVDDMVEELVHKMNEIESIKRDNEELIEMQVKKNELKKRMAGAKMMNVWNIIERLEDYKHGELCDE